MIKLFAMDMDGTSLNSDHKISDDSKNAILQLNQAGVKTIFATGRSIPSISYYSRQIGLDNPMIANNGAITKLGLDGEILNHHPFDDQDLKNILDFCYEHKFNFHFYDEDTYYSNRLIYESLKYQEIDSDYGPNLQSNISIAHDPFVAMKSRGGVCYKILIGFLSRHPYGRDKSRQIIIEEFEDKFYITSSGIENVEISVPDVSKWQAIKELVDFLGIKMDEIAAVGDSFNDREMIENARMGFAMGNANDDVKSAADFIVADNNNKGLNEAADLVLQFNKEHPSV